MPVGFVWYSGNGSNHTLFDSDNWSNYMFFTNHEESHAQLDLGYKQFSVGNTSAISSSITTPNQYESDSLEKNMYHSKPTNNIGVPSNNVKDNVHLITKKPYSQGYNSDDPPKYELTINEYGSVTPQADQTTHILNQVTGIISKQGAEVTDNETDGPTLNEDGYPISKFINNN